MLLKRGLMKNLNVPSLLLKAKSKFGGRLRIRCSYNSHSLILLLLLHAAVLSTAFLFFPLISSPSSSYAFLYLSLLCTLPTSPSAALQAPKRKKKIIQFPLVALHSLGFLVVLQRARIHVRTHTNRKMKK